jgi:hypothetical protein
VSWGSGGRSGEEELLGRGSSAKEFLVADLVSSSGSNPSGLGGPIQGVFSFFLFFLLH